MSIFPAIPAQRILRADDAVRWLDADAVLRQAQAEAARIRASAATEVEAARRQGYEEGHRVGADEGARLLEQARLDAGCLLAGIENDLTDLALTVVARILNGFDDRDLVGTAIRSALAAFGQERDLTVTVAPAMVPHVEAFVEEHFGTARSIEVVPDRHLGSRQCLVSDETGSIDAGVDTQLAVVREMLGESMAGALT
ncbi:type III secretion system stator protein SctL [Novosphingobium kaempferiae]|uniref:type III secretion system stator protein SctL n=1 Tax=Novosphingobium kaempferiae TaxID=2896849 RepID=UPI001E5CBBC6|nr:type III secretion system stator protein SctL [Novosphingobium kaempferiae]